MRYLIPLTVIAGTTEENPSISSLQVVRGELSEIEILFPAGCFGLVNVQIWHGEQQIYPSNPGVAFKADDLNITIEDRYKVEGEPFVISGVGWADLASLNHTVEIQFTMTAKSKQWVYSAEFVDLEGILG
jgi:hypothetical protein